MARASKGSKRRSSGRTRGARSQCRSCPRGETPQILHRDRGIWGGDLPRKIEPLLSTIWAVTEFTKANGATQIVPGSHLWDKDREPTPDEIAYAEMKPGSVFFYTGTVLHGGGAHQTADETRIGLFLHYALNWLRQEENQYLTCPAEIAKDLDQPLQELIGYSMGQYALGYYTPPGKPGEHPEIVPPQYALGHEIEGGMLGTSAELEALQEQISNQE